MMRLIILKKQNDDKMGSFLSCRLWVQEMLTLWGQA